jgi:transcription antitermination factor NusG
MTCKLSHEVILQNPARKASFVSRWGFVMTWFVAMTKPNHEGIAATNLQRQGFDYYYPRYLQKKPNKTPIVKPLFPRYMFIRLQQVWHSLQGTRGISCLLMGETGPQLLADRVIAAIQAREDKHGYYQLIAPPRFQRGSKVKAEAGPFQGLPLLYEGMSTHDRVHCLVQLMGRACTVEIQEKVLAAA